MEISKNVCNFFEALKTIETKDDRRKITIAAFAAPRSLKEKLNPATKRANIYMGQYVCMEGIKSETDYLKVLKSQNVRSILKLESVTTKELKDILAIYMQKYLVTNSASVGDSETMSLNLWNYYSEFSGAKDSTFWYQAYQIFGPFNKFNSEKYTNENISKLETINDWPTKVSFIQSSYEKSYVEYFNELHEDKDTTSGVQIKRLVSGNTEEN